MPAPGRNAARRSARTSLRPSSSRRGAGSGSRPSARDSAPSAYGAVPGGEPVAGQARTAPRRPVPAVPAASRAPRACGARRDRHVVVDRERAREIAGEHARRELEVVERRRARRGGAEPRELGERRAVVAALAVGVEAVGVGAREAARQAARTAPAPTRPCRRASTPASSGASGACRAQLGRRPPRRRRGSAPASRRARRTPPPCGSTPWTA